MNRHLDPGGEGWPGFPRVAYARLERVEPIYRLPSDDAVFAFDAVDADWPGFGSRQVFDLGMPLPTMRQRLRGHWNSLFRTRRPPRLDPVGDAYDRVPTFHIEVSAKPDDQFYNRLAQVTETEWVTLRLSPPSSYEVDVYGGLFAEPVVANLDAIEPNQHGERLNLLFDMTTWPDANVADIRSALAFPRDLQFLVAHDVGQGSAAALCDQGETALSYFDLGRGAYRNAKTAPAGSLRFCWRGGPQVPVVLSHWDADHWAGARHDGLAATRTWVVPRQTITPAAALFAARIVKSGKLLVWNARPGSRLRVSTPGGQTVTYARCTGSPATRNGSGISCMVEDTAKNEVWILTGDAGYHELGLSPGTAVTAALAPHHGATMDPKSIPPGPHASYARVIYSFGPGNQHGRHKISHPTIAGVDAHTKVGWNHGTWGPGTAPGNTVPGHDALATATHPSTHDDSAAASWTSQPTVPFRTVPCGSPTTKSGCTSNVRQA